MSSTALYRALVEAGASEQTAKEAADTSEELSNAVVELKTSIRILIVINIALVLLELRGVFA
jgi:hypothetical protein